MGRYSEQLIAEVRLALTPGVGPRLRANLIARFGSANDVVRQPVSVLTSTSGIGPKLAEALAAARGIDVEAELSAAAEAGVVPLALDDPHYPEPLRSICDPPGVLFVRGDPLPDDRLAVAIVGSRHATRYGLRQAETLARELARAGVVVVSGLARGIDGAAHRGALEAGGRTIAVLGGGLLRLYPPEHAGLADRVAAQGWLMSEAPPNRPPISGAFPQRNRVISGLSLGVVVVEAAQRSGALITTTHAAEQGRDVFAVPGPIDSPLSAGCHRLIQDGAKLVASVDDILEEIDSASSLRQSAAPAPQSAPTPELNDTERAVWGLVSTAPTAIDTIVERSGLGAAAVLSTLSGLEMRGIVRRHSGAFVARS
ncbi:hypothetical protein Pla175_05020 [Pirellulimonas nuda]|uniref:Uncharacterized protein n=1 Tax=Pirellulimonas nuda TaxID=2528009 RepID=A0A518D6Q8_9BACT|nr:DNA-processing protein DprA [Pirellulimonas nuda]QDU87146.1 hypothetical protein Pla175_05020 [Pirellulimonas nuda]